MQMNKQTLKEDGFTGFQSFREMEINRVPQVPGIYAVLKPEGFQPLFLAKSVGGQFKKRDPSLFQAALETHWIEDAEVLYIGKAGAGTAGTRGLRQRIQELADFGRGKPVGHWGGRLLWQLADSQSLVIAWKELEAAEVNSTEAAYQAEFISLCGRLPFANLVQARGKG
ncbi:hypothetical protein [Pseudarthrobacter sp. NBSH8]|uniref:hypothetical protein n=1 Tax=Pseudarthrobacter sp. NBSH8 TaxID=2596911 RepID=UPI0016270FFE|nr:hypothetical protein [Pseudarthrobacter sp. NBSH8]QNE13822.1 hypothetical protein FYJ92_04700 [Pseudarthrobacter sp. NBSH8]